MTDWRAVPLGRRIAVVLPMVVSLALAGGVLVRRHENDRRAPFCAAVDATFGRLADEALHGSANDLLTDPPALARVLRGLDMRRLLPDLPAAERADGRLIARGLPGAIAILERSQPPQPVVSLLPQAFVRAVSRIGTAYARRCN